MNGVKTRIEPQAASAWSDEVRTLLGAAPTAVESASDEPEAKPQGPVAILQTVAHHPALLGPMLQFSSALALRGVLSRRDSELLALRAAYNCQSPFEWAQHANYARAAGLAEGGRVFKLAGGLLEAEVETLLLQLAKLIAELIRRFFA